MHLSVVIITRNEEKNIAECVRSARFVTDDIIVIDAASEDNTVAIATMQGARVFSLDWKGYGFSRNYGAAKAKYEWILAMDADERLDAELIQSIKHTAPANEATAYGFSRHNYIGGKRIRFGTVGYDKVRRIYHRKFCQWDLSPVHEKLEGFTETKKLRGHVIHDAFKDIREYKAKAVQYALMSAEKYYREGKKAGWLKRLSSPVFNSIKSYVFKLGFLDGKKGLHLAYIIAYYSWLKYDYLQQLYIQSSDPVLRFEPNTR